MGFARLAALSGGSRRRRRSVCEHLRRRSRGELILAIGSDDLNGELATTVDPLGRRVTRTFDDQGNVAALALPGGAVWTFAHDGLSRLQAVTDPTGATWRREYDVNGGLAATVDPTGVRQEVARDVATGVATLRDAFSATTFRFDEFGRVFDVSGSSHGRGSG
ncbi:hypothetical protein ACIPEQ_13080 [Curtobacterium sp. NPDC087080]|uniref:hypothetical protein n=1 Tax=Curtobacterium sp. NPDC087080 TaxID=3363965 RepID=UPI003800D146